MSVIPPGPNQLRWVRNEDESDWHLAWNGKAQPVESGIGWTDTQSLCGDLPSHSNEGWPHQLELGEFVPIVRCAGCAREAKGMFGLGDE